VGDPRRFEAFADYVERHWPARDARIADVAGGNGGLQAALHRLGYSNVLTIDKRRRFAKSRPMFRYGLFSEDESEHFDLVLGMHPDGATEMIIVYARDHGIPFAVVPCCSVGKRTDYPLWMGYLERLAGPHEVDLLPIRGRNLVIRPV
jgi:hypothetical protein